ncbi:fimbrial biogenesis chaperone [Algoriphagus boritolerans]|uniref:Pili and flagellar-assembly chaperone, PapD N-terminal domain n=1 Tax=Algoriphagus boritolerans DSM 17298 = JCM 18970 TaxID=1120964 RepID=A0A1H6AML8_9BACT|nr:molecular chaperone [Algoriphagus boritolerans]SEG49791.1 hypothetical protein SAMN03080598_04219 [Algoriphagus boritolerans DSM 17298 = JCM 18970]
MKYAGFWIVLLLLLTDLNQSFAQGDLMIYPRRLVFGSSQRSMDVTLANSGTDSSTYALSWKNYRMTSSGQFTEITEPDSGQYLADEILRFFPREVTLAPGESQKVKVQRISNRQLPEGEYRSHLEFRSAKPMDATTPSASEEQDQIQTQLNMHLAITIPVIMEIGSITAQVELKNVTWIASDSKSLQLRFDIHRSGKKSSYGDFTLTHRSADGKMTQVGLVKGVAVYAPIKKRSYSVPVTIPAGVTINEGELILEYISQTKRKEILASLVVPLK